MTAVGRQSGSGLVAPAAGVAASAPARRPPGAPLRIALIGNPNTGKSTLFNALTGMRQKVGNFAGVTVERVEGVYRDAAGARVTVLDLPGSYSLSAGSPDEEIALAVLLGRDPDEPRPDVVVVVADALHLERNLYLTSQVLELGVPTVVALNQIDAAAAAGVQVDAVELIHELGVTVVPMIATRGEGIDQLRHACAVAVSLPRPARRFALPPAAAAALTPVESALVAAGFAPGPAAMEALRLLSVSAPEAHLAHVPGLAGEVGAGGEGVHAAPKPDCATRGSRASRPAPSRAPRAPRARSATASTPWCCTGCSAR
jgi:ferrous iron transport protein B